MVTRSRRGSVDVTCAVNLSDKAVTYDGRALEAWEGAILTN